MDGMNDDQIWEQLDLRAKKFCDIFEETLESTSEELEDNEDVGLEEIGLRNLINGDAGLEELEGMDWDVEDSLEDEDSEDDEDEDEESDRQSEKLGEDITQELRDPSEEGSEEELPFLDLTAKMDIRPKRKTSRHSELDDDFFNLASFNAEADESEAKSVSKGRLGEDDDGDSDDDMSVDLFAPVDDPETFEEDDLEDTGAGMIENIIHNLSDADNFQPNRTVLS